MATSTIKNTFSAIENKSITVATGTYDVFTNKQGLYLAILSCQNQATGGYWSVKLRDATANQTVAEILSLCDISWGYAHVPTVVRTDHLVVKVDNLPDSPEKINVKYIKLD